MNQKEEQKTFNPHNGFDQKSQNPLQTSIQVIEEDDFPTSKQTPLLSHPSNIFNDDFKFTLYD